MASLVCARSLLLGIIVLQWIAITFLLAQLMDWHAMDGVFPTNGGTAVVTTCPPAPQSKPVAPPLLEQASQFVTAPGEPPSSLPGVGVTVRN